MHCHRLNYFWFLNALVGFNYGHSITLNHHYELFMLCTLFVEHLNKPSIEELQIDTKYFHDVHSLNGIRFYIGFMQDCGHHDLFQPFDEDAQEVFYAPCKLMRTVKISVVYVVKRKWTYEVALFPMWASHATAWK